MKIMRGDQIAFALAVALAIIVAIAAPSSAQVTSTGTGFAVTFDGMVVTNDHVVDGCTRLRARNQGTSAYFYEASIFARDRSVDLAAIRLHSRTASDGRRPLKAVPRALLRESASIELGESAITYGFPLRGLLASQGNFTVGHVTALKGISDNPNYVQISTPVQPGNSGGALLDGSGNVIGVVAAKLNALAIMRATGDLSQNVNFAIELATLKRFLAMKNIAVAQAQSKSDLPMKQIGWRAQLFTYLIECEAGQKRVREQRQ